MGLIRRFLGDERGNIATMAAFSLPILIGGAAMGTEAGYWYTQKSKLRFSTDAAAITAANLYQRGEKEASIKSAVKSSMERGGYDVSKLTLDIKLPVAVGDQLTVDTRVAADKYFSKVVTSTEINIAARTVVEFSAGQVCVLATHPTASRALEIMGNTDVNLGTCLGAANSINNDAVYLNGSMEFKAGCLYSGGGVTEKKDATLDCSKPMTNKPPVKGPLDGMVQPPTPGGCQSVSAKNKSNLNLTPGCFSSFSSSNGATINFAPGVYYVTGDMSLTGGTLTGTGVTFIFKNAGLTMNGGATINLTAPAQGSSPPVAGKPHYPGVLFWGRSTGATKTIKINGGATSSMLGIISFENDDVQFLGDAGFKSDCVRLIGNTVKMSGNSKFEADCKVQLGGLSMDANGKLRIVQ